MSWSDPSPTPLTYNVWRGSSEIATSISATSFLDAGLTPSTGYTYTVQAISSGGTSPPSGSFGTSTGVAPAGYSVTPPQPPGTPTATPPSTNSPGVTLTWSASPDVSHEVISYEVDRNGVALGGTTLTSFTDTTATTGVAYT